MDTDVVQNRKASEFMHLNAPHKAMQISEFTG